jgi:hypothetical protein
MGTRIAAALVLAFPLIILSPDTGTVFGQGLDPKARHRLDDRRFKARTTLQYLSVAAEYAQAGLPGEAKLTVDDAAKVAVKAFEWSAVAKAYQSLGYQENAAFARRKAADAQR